MFIMYLPYIQPLTIPLNNLKYVLISLTPPPQLEKRPNKNGTCTFIIDLSYDFNLNLPSNFSSCGQTYMSKTTGL